MGFKFGGISNIVLIVISPKSTSNINSSQYICHDIPSNAQETTSSVFRLSQALLQDPVSRNMTLFDGLGFFEIRLWRDGRCRFRGITTAYWLVVTCCSLKECGLNWIIQKLKSLLGLAFKDNIHNKLLWLISARLRILRGHFRHS